MDTCKLLEPILILLVIAAKVSASNVPTEPHGLPSTGAGSSARDRAPLGQRIPADGGTAAATAAAAAAPLIGEHAPEAAAAASLVEEHASGAAAASLVEEHASGALEQADALPSSLDKIWSAADVMAKEQCGGTHPEGTDAVAAAAVSLLEKHASDALGQTDAEPSSFMSRSTAAMLEGGSLESIVDQMAKEMAKQGLCSKVAAAERGAIESMEQADVQTLLPKSSSTTGSEGKREGSTADELGQQTDVQAPLLKSSSTAGLEGEDGRAELGQQRSKGTNVATASEAATAPVARVSSRQEYASAAVDQEAGRLYGHGFLWGGAARQKSLIQDYHNRLVPYLPEDDLSMVHQVSSLLKEPLNTPGGGGEQSDQSTITQVLSLLDEPLGSPGSEDMAEDEDEDDQAILQKVSSLTKEPLKSPESLDEDEHSDLSISKKVLSLMEEPLSSPDLGQEDGENQLLLHQVSSLVEEQLSSPGHVDEDEVKDQSTLDKVLSLVNDPLISPAPVDKDDGDKQPTLPQVSALLKEEEPSSRPGPFDKDGDDEVFRRALTGSGPTYPPSYPPPSPPSSLPPRYPPSSLPPHYPSRPNPAPLPPHPSPPTPTPSPSPPSPSPLEPLSPTPKPGPSPPSPSPPNPPPLKPPSSHPKPPAPLLLDRSPPAPPTPAPSLPPSPPNPEPPAPLLLDTSPPSPAPATPAPPIPPSPILSTPLIPPTPPAPSLVALPPAHPLPLPPNLETPSPPVAPFLVPMPPMPLEPPQNPPFHPPPSQPPPLQPPQNPSSACEDVVERYQRAFPPCDSAEDCDVAVGETCGAAPASCIRYVCDESSGQVISTECGNTCDPSVWELQQRSAVLKDSGGAFTVALTADAQSYEGPCALLFDDPSMTLLGSMASCRGEGRLLEVTMSADALLQVNDSVSLRPAQEALVGSINHTPFSGTSGPVARCTSCDRPQAQIVGMAVVNNACDDDSPPQGLMLSGSTSSGTAGRPLVFVEWSLVSFPDQGQDLQDLQGAIVEANERDELILELPGSLTASLALGEYTISLAVGSWLNTQGSIEHTFTKQESSASPSACIDTPDAIVLSGGVPLAATVNPFSVCDGRKVVFFWQCVRLERDGQDLECALLDEDHTFDRANPGTISSVALTRAGVSIGDVLHFTLNAFFEGSSPESAPTLSKAVLAEGDDVQARLDGPQGLVHMREGNLLNFSAAGSVDPSDPDNSDAEMRFNFGCKLDADQLAPCFQDVSYSGTLEGSTWVLDASMFAEPDRRFLVSVTAFKGQGQVLRADTATSIIVPRTQPVISATIARFCASSACPTKISPTDVLTLLVRLDDESNVDASGATFRWSILEDQASLLGIQLDDTTTNGLTLDSVTIFPSAIPSSGSLMVQCEVQVGDLLGKPIISLPISSPPVCGASEGSVCLHIPRNESTFPDNAFVANAIQWTASTTGRLAFEFGLLAADGSRVVERPASPKRSHTFRAVESGLHRPYVCAIGMAGGTACVENSFLLRPNDQFTVDDVLENLDSLSFQDLLNAGDFSSIWETIRAMVALLNAIASDADLAPRQRERIEALLQDARDAVDTVTNSQGADEQDGENTVNSEYRMGPRGNAEKSLKNIIRGLELMEASGAAVLSANTAGNALESTIKAAKVMSGSAPGGILIAKGKGSSIRRQMLQSADDAAITAVQELEGAVGSIGRQREDQVVPGLPEVLERPGLSLLMLRNSQRTTSSSSVAFPSGKAGAEFPGEGFLAWCRKDPQCSAQDTLVTKLTWLDDGELYAAATRQLSDPARLSAGDEVVNVTVVSGTLDAQLTYKPNAQLCEGHSEEACNIRLTMPIERGVFDSSKATLCARLEASEEGDGTYVAAGNVTMEPFPSTMVPDAVSCVVNKLGKHTVLQYATIKDLGARPEPAPGTGTGTGTDAPPVGLEPEEEEGDEGSKEETLLLGLAIGIPVGVVFLLALVSLVLLVLRRKRKRGEDGKGASKVAPEGGVPSGPSQSDEGWAHPLPPPVPIPGSSADDDAHTPSSYGGWMRKSHEGMGHNLPLPFPATPIPHDHSSSPRFSYVPAPSTPSPISLSRPMPSETDLQVLREECVVPSKPEPRSPSVAAPASLHHSFTRFPPLIQPLTMPKVARPISGQPPGPTAAPQALLAPPGKPDYAQHTISAADEADTETLEAKPQRTFPTTPTSEPDPPVPKAPSGRPSRMRARLHMRSERHASGGEHVLDSALPAPQARSQVETLLQTPEEHVSGEQALDSAPPIPHAPSGRPCRMRTWLHAPEKQQHASDDRPPDEHMLDDLPADVLPVDSAPPLPTAPSGRPSRLRTRTQLSKKHAPPQQPSNWYEPHDRASAPASAAASGGSTPSAHFAADAAAADAAARPASALRALPPLPHAPSTRPSCARARLRTDKPERRAAAGPQAASEAATTRITEHDAPAPTLPPVFAHMAAHDAPAPTPGGAQPASLEAATAHTTVHDVLAPTPEGPPAPPTAIAHTVVLASPEASATHTAIHDMPAPAPGAPPVPPPLPNAPSKRPSRARARLAFIHSAASHSPVVNMHTNEGSKEEGMEVDIFGSCGEEEEAGGSPQALRSVRGVPTAGNAWREGHEVAAADSSVGVMGGNPRTLKSVPTAGDAWREREAGV